MKHASFLLLCALCALGQVQKATVSGTVVDASGSTISRAQVTLSRDDNTAPRDAIAGEDGQFTFEDVAPGAFHLTISTPGFASQTVSGSLAAGETASLPPITLAVAILKTDMQVTLTQTEIAEDQIKQQEKQRLLGIVPNYYVNYLPDAAPLNPKQKLELSWKFVIDPISFGITGAIAGVQQAQNNFGGFGQGSEGYAKRYAASYANFLTGTVISSALLPIILKQDPRYFYKGTGTIRSRILYAVANSVIRKGDNGRWQPNYSDILGSLASGGISNLYYPAKNRDGVSLTFENALIGIAGSAGGNLLEEFLSRKLTPSVHHKKPSKDAPAAAGQ